MIAKKAESTVPKFLVEIVIFILVFIAISIGASRLWKLYVTKPDQVTDNSLDLLVMHVKYFDSDISDTFPLQVDKRHIIKGYDKEDSSKPDNFEPCKDISCICILTSSEQTVVKCKSLESSTNEDIRLIGDFQINFEENVQNFYLQKEDSGKISINYG